MLTTPKAARTEFADLTQNCALPLEPDALLRTDLLHHHGHTVIGDVALRAYKHKSRWTYDDRDIRRAGRHFADLHVDLADLMEVQLPAYSENTDPEDWNRADWRRQLMHWMFDAARRKAFEELPYDVAWDTWKEIGEHGLPGGLTMTEFVEARPQSSYWRTIAATRPLDLLTWSGTHWLLPRVYVELLDRWEQLEEDLTNRARICSTCGAQGPRWAWRTPTANGYITLCPACSGAAYQAYQGHLRGVPYASLPRATRADAYLCWLCGESRAFTWDHCHDHGYVRGPLCASCNTFEGKGVRFLEREGSILHLLECRGCRDQQTLPQRFRTDIIRDHLERTQRHGRCRNHPHVRALEHDHGAYRFTLTCHSTTWTHEVSATEAATLVRAVVEQALAADPDMIL
ncbi:endonuclease domain-containing protein [Streptomyces sp. NPDC001262]|uniref:endonuclease domain-containing protein n=1 Tax=Streptomyces sp. NPDC001262 TaxID=3364552 RepID=UPI0036ABFBC8